MKHLFKEFYIFRHPRLAIPFTFITFAKDYKNNRTDNPMKKSILLLFAALLPLVASAEKVEIDGIWYNLVSKAKQAEVTYKGDSYDEYNEYSGSITIPATVTYEGVNYSVTSIGESAFCDCSNLKSVNIPESVKSIEVGAFGSSSLESINIPKNSQLTSIGYYAFSGCSSLTTIDIPEGVTSIGSSTFYNCSSLTTINIPKNLQLTSIEEFAFLYCSSLTSIDIPEGVTRIAGSAFQGCSSLTAITIPENSQLTSIGSGAFEGCSSLTAIDIPESVTGIEGYAFSGCSSLTSINIPKRVTSIESGAFKGCSSLAEINVPEGVTSIGRYAFRDCNNLTTFVLPKSLKYIDQEAFANCAGLLDVYCHAKTVPLTESNAFEKSFPEYMTLHVPASALNGYKTTAPWSSFGNIVALTEEEMDVEQLTKDNSQLIIYNLCGQRIDRIEQGGIYIVNGKKVVIK